MRRNIRPLFNFDPPASEEDIRASAVQFVRKVSGRHRLGDGGGLLPALGRNGRAELSADRTDHPIDGLVRAVGVAAGRAADVGFRAAGAGSLSHGLPSRSSGWLAPKDDTPRPARKERAAGRRTPPAPAPLATAGQRRGRVCDCRRVPANALSRDADRRDAGAIRCPRAFNVGDDAAWLRRPRPFPALPRESGRCGVRRPGA